jgi:hypothetical protein
LFSAPKSNLGGHIFKGDGEVETDVIRRLITEEADFNRWRVVNLVEARINATVMRVLDGKVI